ncbi:MAG: hypothetical protein HY053_09240, partial [Proteobacteria bacterium]|nr:hypothetical protein [Pseudomonadota bacterium]
MSLLSLHSSQVALGSGSALEQKQNLSHAILFTLLALAAMAGHFILVANFDVFGFLWIIGVMMMSFFLSSELVFALVMTSLFLQNVFVAILSPQIKDVNHFSVMLASSFVIIALAAMAAMFIWNQLRHRLPTDSRAMLRGLIFFFIVVVIYTVIGAVFSNLVSALVYTRVYLTGGMLLALGVTLGLGAPLNYAINVIRLMALILIVWGIAEFLLTYDLYSLFHALEYFNLKLARALNYSSFREISEMIDFRNSSFLNLSGAFGLDFFLLRPNGPNLHPISYAYARAFCSLVCFICRSHFLMAGCLILALLVGAKGPLVMLSRALVLYVFHTNFRKQPRVVLIALVCS